MQLYLCRKLLSSLLLFHIVVILGCFLCWELMFQSREIKNLRITLKLAEIRERDTENYRLRLEISIEL